MTDQMAAYTADKARRIQLSLAKRRNREWRFRVMGVASILVAFAFLLGLMISIVLQGYTAFLSTEIKLTVDLTPAALGLPKTPDGENGLYLKKSLENVSYRRVLRQAIRAEFPEITERRHQRTLYQFISNSAEYDFRDRIISNPSLVGGKRDIWVLAGDDVNQYQKGNISRDLPEESRQFKDHQVNWYNSLLDQDKIRTVLNRHFFSRGDSRDPESAGILGATVGSFYTLLVTFLLSFPIGVAAAIYLEEFAPKNKITDFIEININNLAAVPSIVFGLLGLAVFLNFVGLPRSAPVVGGLVLALMTLPTIIISSRAAIKSVAPSIRDAAYGMGASKMQVVMHHVVPLAMPGMLTGAIIGMAQALGETAPLLMIGMVAFIVEIPNGPFDAATALPVQIFLWADNPERGFVENTSGAIMILLAFLILMNSAALLLRKRLERQSA
ncbi:phosphate ABC transporter permease PstA [Photobacterium galatheae]|uniref:Phosphate transport system permease protein PstA n=1 Tax=Photobacterium galatheae TaxID=1654360 RepID=A0A066RPM4_9GAMM|nr:phosphate ABC transporter permease PstA [Photobacterium galatheae]KDM89622.1 phosphate ABC transporter permease [Photobacterium galatheae]MCM0150226.1 phosphate ABC transporter permease PstA [Photobacterium galatheae]